jgi:hypothetical protein
MLLACIPAYARAAFASEHALPQGNNSPRPVVAGAPHPSSKTARPLNSRPSGRDDIDFKGLAPASSADSKPARARVGTSGARSTSAGARTAGASR